MVEVGEGLAQAVHIEVEGWAYTVVEIEGRVHTVADGQTVGLDAYTVAYTVDPPSGGCTHTVDQSSVACRHDGDQAAYTVAGAYTVAEAYTGVGGYTHTGGHRCIPVAEKAVHTVVGGYYYTGVELDGAGSDMELDWWTGYALGWHRSH